MAVHPVLTLRDLLRVVVEQEVDLDAELHFSIEDVDGVDAEGEDVRVMVEGEFNYADHGITTVYELNGRQFEVFTPKPQEWPVDEQGWW